jgi:hypothetical protein
VVVSTPVVDERGYTAETHTETHSPGALTRLVPVVPAGGDTAAEAASSAGVVESGCGIGGSASKRCAEG